MQIINKTQFPRNLIDLIIEEVGLDTNVPDRLIITVDRRLKRQKGVCKPSQTRLGYLIRVMLKEEGDVLTLAHELRHYQQLQAYGPRFFQAVKYFDICEADAELMEEYLESEGY